MAYFSNSRPNALFSQVEFTQQGGNRAFFYGVPEHSEALQAYVTGQLGQTVIASTHIDGQNVLITCGNKNQQELMQGLARHGELLTPYVHKAQFHPWKWRGGLNFAGQGLQLASGYLKEGGLDAPKLIFASSNILASIINVTFGEQHSDDTHQLKFLKEKLNHALAPQVSDPALLPSADDNRLHLHGEEDTHENRFTEFMRRHSVRFGEMGLRFFASVALTFPVTRWKPALAALKSGGIMKGFRAARNPDDTGFYAGSVYLVGKTIGLFSKTPDPYNPKPPTILDTLQEKVLFRLSSAIETGAASTLAYGSLKSGEISFGGKKYRDYIGGAGGTLLASSLITRYFAPFGVKDVNRKELEAHLADSLALVPPETLPQVAAETIGILKEHFKDKAPSFGEMYAYVMDDLNRHHPQQPVVASADMSAVSHTERLRREPSFATRNI